MLVHVERSGRYMLIVLGFGGAPMVLGGGTIADLIPREQRGTAMAVWMMGPSKFLKKQFM
jgi:MFS family permease